jgi:hypothetical protein
MAVEPQEIYSVTTAQVGTAQEQTGRVGRYLFSMGIRTACVIAAVIIPGWPRWLFLVGAVFLPYIAVVVANAGREKMSRESILTPESTHVALPAGPETPQP